jgi:ubiquinone/menaquinone biosynthesis C-methylase UbiE
MSTIAPLPRTPEPELMDDEAQARAYAEADFSEPHDHFVTLFQEFFTGLEIDGRVADLGCGTADVTVRFARAYPACRIDGVDGSTAMLHYGRAAISTAGLGERVSLLEGMLPEAALPAATYPVVICNSLLHHLHRPGVLWATIDRLAEPGAAVFVMDLMRPTGADELEKLVATYVADEAPILQHDFRASLHAAFTVTEVIGQLHDAALDWLEVCAVSDRHLVISGQRPA